MLVRVKKHPTLGVLVASNGMVFNRASRYNTYKWTFGTISGIYGRKIPYARVKIAGRLYQVHRLVAETFLPNLEGKKQVDHILRDSLDNNVCQIRWATPSENNRNRVNTTEFAELLAIDSKAYHKVWRSMHTEKRREKYRKKREAGFHVVRDADGKQHWEKILNESPRPRTSKTKSPMSLVKVKNST